jgi:uncharacterized LabA/DUF88 family protein
VTTEHMHHEHNDANEAIVTNAPAPESTVEISDSDATTVEEPGTNTTPVLSEPVASPDIQDEVQEQSPAILTANAADSQMAEVESHPVSFEQEQHSQETVRPEPTAAQTDESPATAEATGDADKNFAFSSPEEMPFVATNEDEVRPFTAFIEEFRQAEEQARLNTALQESPTETFTLFSGVDEQAQVRSESYETGIESVPASSEIAPAASLFTEAAEVEEVEQTAPAAIANEEIAGEAAASVPPIPALKRPAVSPLLRPASRMRSSRHSTRHQRPETGNEIVVPTSPTETTLASPELRSESDTASATQTEQPKPARRYRFDRPAATTNGTLGTTAPTPTPPFARTEPLANGNEALTETVAKAPAGSTSTVPSEPQAVKPLVGLEQGTVEDTRSAAVMPRENGRRSNGQERQKEPVVPVAAPVTDTAAVVTEATTGTEKVAPEDLPPLEYSELQKNTRKRRRHRTTTSNGSTPIASVAALPPIVPAATPAPQAPIETPAAPAAQAPTMNPTTGSAPYSIVSGYTVSQMNQGNESSGPFMGPEPSPARGSLITRETRSVQRPPIASPSYPARSGEAMPSSASFNHFTNMMVQALQTQTDRMVAEMRRANQVPTNVTVSLPPFPSTERVGVFVDVANLLYSARTLRISVDFGKLLDFLRGNRRLVRAHAYCPTSPQAGDEQMFLQAVKGLGYRITTKNYKTFSSGAKKADLDLDLCMDVVRIVDGGAVDCIVLVSGDSDFMPMLDYCSDHGVRVEVAAFDEAMSATLRQSCDLFINLSMLEEIRS